MCLGWWAAGWVLTASRKPGERKEGEATGGRGAGGAVRGEGDPPRAGSGPRAWAVGLAMWPRTISS